MGSADCCVRAPRSAAGIFSLFGALDGELGFFVQDEVSAYFGGKDPEQKRGPLPGKCVHVSFDRVPPWQSKPPEALEVSAELQMQLQGDFALRVQRPPADRDRRPQQARVQLEVQASIVYIRFVGEPVIVEKLWLARDLPAEGHAANPIILRGRHNVEEYWSVYLRYVDFLEQGWLSPALTPVPISEIVILGGQGLRIGSMYLSVLEGSHPNSTDATQGWIMAPVKGMLSLHDVLIGKLPAQTHAAVLSLGEIRRGARRLRPDLLADPHSVAAVEVAQQLRSFKAGGGQSETFQPAAVAHFSDTRTTGAAMALFDALLTGALKFPEDISLEVLEWDAELYAKVYGEVTLEEAANARSVDDLYERLFTAHHLDGLDLLFSRFLWANFSATLAKPGGVMSEEPTSSFQPVSNQSWLPLHDNSEVASRRRMLIAHLQEHTALYLRWQEPIEGKLAFVNSTGSVEVAFRLYESLTMLGVDYYNGASGKSLRLDVDLPDSEYFLAELLGLHSQLLVDDQGIPLPPEQAQELHEARTYLDTFAGLLMELQQNTSEAAEAVPGQLPFEDDFQLTVDEDIETSKVSANTPPMLLVLGVSCFVVGTVLLAALGPAPERWPFARLWQSLGRLVLFVSHFVGRLMRLLGGCWSWAARGMLGLWAAQEAWQLQQRAINRDGWAPSSRCSGSSPTA
ncbi:unnamed protein product [Symbiodinium natans]|uniref:Uncharacterized protein n=1 Tax=Symbiodinium natans TaxID=878477 RepID=A0A812NEN9_9DINO|nr:unnamed protein product [Symbiodinium natans]